MPEIPLGTVVGPQGPPGPKGDTGTFSPEDLQRISDLESGKVDKVSGKGLSTNDYTTAEKNAVATISNKVDKVSGKGLSTNDYTTADKNKLSGIAAEANKTLIDATLSNAGQAADAKATGDKFSALQSLIRRMEIHCTASGNPATFSDADAANVKALSVTITPTQSGSGTPSPSNIRPISGVSSVTVTRTRRNLLPQTVTETATINASESGTVIYTPLGAGRWKAARGRSSTGYAQLTFANKIPIENTPLLAEQSYYLTGIPSNVTGGTRITVLAYASDGETILSGVNYSDPATPTAFAIPQNTAFVSAYFSYSATQQGEVVFSPMLRSLSDTDATYEAYQGQSVTVSLVDSNSNPLTVYGGTLNVTTGELTVTHKLVTLNSSNYFAKSSSNLIKKGRAGYYLSFPGFSDCVNSIDDYNAGGVVMLYSHASSGVSAMQAAASEDFAIGVGITTNSSVKHANCWINISSETASSVYELGAWLDTQQTAGTPLQVVYPLAAPLTYQLTPAQLATLSGYNSVSTDAASVSVTYKADTSIILGGG